MGFFVTSILIGATIVAMDPPAPTGGRIDAEIRSLRLEIEEYRSEIREDPDRSFDRERSDAIRSLVADVLADAEGRTSLRGSDSDVPWNEIASESRLFTLQLGVFQQADWALNARPGETVVRGFEVENTYLNVSGNAYGPTWTYWMRLTLGSGPDGGTGAQYAYIQGDLGDGWSVQAGRLTPCFSYEQALNTSSIVGIYLSFIAGQFDPESSEGVSLTWQGDDLRGWVTVCNGFNPANASAVRNNRRAFIARGEWKPFGNWNDLYLPNAFPEKVEPGLLLGLGGSYGDGSTYPQGAPAQSGQAFRVTGDVTWQRPGASISTSLNWQDASEQVESGGKRLAAMVEGGFWPDAERGEDAHWILYGRGEWGSVPDSDFDDLAIATIGASWYASSDRTLKWSLEFIRAWGDTTQWRIDGNPGFIPSDGPQSIVRSQIQIVF